MCVLPKVPCVWFPAFFSRSSHMKTQKVGNPCNHKKWYTLSVCMSVQSCTWLSAFLVEGTALMGPPLEVSLKRKLSVFLSSGSSRFFLGQKIESFGGAVLKVNFEGGRVKWLLDIVSLDRPLLEKESHLLPMKYPIMAVLLPLGFFTNS